VRLEDAICAWPYRERLSRYRLTIPIRRWSTSSVCDGGLLQDDRPQPGDWVLIHVGFAMSKISEQDAYDQMQTLRMLGETEAAMQEVEGYGLGTDSDTKPI
jgi:hydrogenase assembly chaperone HypC/HupF